MLYEIVESREVSGNVISDEIVRLTAANTAVKYPQTFRRVRAIVDINGERREMTFLTNNVKWAASTICELYKARWEISVLAPRRNSPLGRVDGSRHRGNPAPLWDGITPASTATSLHPAVFGGLLSARI